MGEGVATAYYMECALETDAVRLGVGLLVVYGIFPFCLLLVPSTLRLWVLQWLA